MESEIVNRVEFNNLTDETVEEESLLRDVLMFAMDKEKLKDTSFDVIFVDNKYIHELNKGGLNTSLNTNTTKWLNALAADPNKTELRYDSSFTNDTVVNAEAAIKEAMIMANIKSLGNITQK